MFSFNADNFKSLMAVFYDVLKNSNKIITSPMTYDQVQSPLIDSVDHHDYTRWRTMQLCAEMIASNEELAKSDACVAEAGVWKGGFSCMINAAFANRTLHLFDTFEGFDMKQVDHDIEKGLISTFFRDEQTFNSTSIEAVKAVLPHADKAVFHKGMIEKTCREVKDLKFVFVSLDMDLKQPMATALEFFYERTLPGGYLFLHDYNHSSIKGVKEVISEFEAKHGRLNKLPLADEGGSIIIVR